MRRRFSGGDVVRAKEKATASRHGVDGIDGEVVQHLANFRPLKQREKNGSLLQDVQQTQALPSPPGWRLVIKGAKASLLRNTISGPHSIMVGNCMPSIMFTLARSV